MVLAFIVLSIVAGAVSYVSLPKEGEPDIEIPRSSSPCPSPAISAEDSESLLVRPMETELSDLDGLKTMTATAAEGYANIVLEFEFRLGQRARFWPTCATGCRRQRASFPRGFEQYSIAEFNFSEFPIIIVNLSGGAVPRTHAPARRKRVAGPARRPRTGSRCSPRGATATRCSRWSSTLCASRPTTSPPANSSRWVQNNNQLIAAGEVEGSSGRVLGEDLPRRSTSSRTSYDLPVKVDGDRVVTLGDSRRHPPDLRGQAGHGAVQRREPRSRFRSSSGRASTSSTPQAS